MKNLLRKILPRRLISAARILLIMHREHGHVNRRNGFPVSGRGEYQPWLTYPLIEYLKGFDFSQKRIFEFGAGASTLFWASRARCVESVELDRRWFNSLVKIVPSNVVLNHQSDEISYAQKIIEADGQFDVIVVDGAERYRSAEAALEKLIPGGMIILDNAEWYPVRTRENRKEEVQDRTALRLPLPGCSCCAMAESRRLQVLCHEPE